MILEESGFTSYVCDALEIRQSNLIGQLIRTLYPKERQHQVNIPVEDRNGCDEEASDLNSTIKLLFTIRPLRSLIAVNFVQGTFHLMACRRMLLDYLKFGAAQ